MEQLRMKCTNLVEAPVNLRAGYSIVDSLTKEYSMDELSKAWGKICEELNGKYDEERYKTRMLADKRIPEGAIYFVRDNEGQLISTAAMIVTEEPGIAALHMVGTRADAKGKGAGAAVSAYCVNDAIKRNISQMWLKTDDFRIPAIKIYYRLGFLPWLFEEGMRERWTIVAKNLGWDLLKVLNEKGEEETITIAG